MPVVGETPGVAGAQPAAFQRGPGGLGILVVPEKDAVAALEDLALRGEREVHAWDRTADGLEPDVAVAVHAAEPGDLCLAVQLLEVQSEGTQEPKGIGAQRRSTRVGVADPQHPQIVEDGSKRQQVPEPREDPVGQPERLPAEALVGRAVPPAHREVVGDPLERRRVHDLDLDLAGERLPQARRSEQHRRPDLAAVGVRGLALFGEVHRDPEHERGRDRHRDLPDPRRRQVGEELIVRPDRVHLGEGQRHVDQVAVSQHRPPGGSRGPGGVHDVGDVFGRATQ